MRRTDYDLPIFEDTDVADLNAYTEDLANKLKVQIDRFGNPLTFKGRVPTLNDLPNNATPGDIYNVTSINKNYVYSDDEEEWLEYSDTIDNSCQDMIADEYSTSKTYAVGDFCIKNNMLYRCKTAITVAEAWNTSHWEAVTLGDQIKKSYLYSEIETKEFFNSATNTHYWITKVPYRDSNGNVIKIKHGFANDEISDDCIADETPRSFAKRHNATLCVNASIFGIDSQYSNYQHIIGPIIHDGQVISNYNADGYQNTNQIKALAFDQERNFKVYPYTTNAIDILNEGYTETVVAFKQLIENGQITTSDTTLAQWNILAYNSTTKDLYFCCCNGKNINDEQGMSIVTLLNILIDNFGCTFAYRLDAGGSTSLIKDSIMLNQPTDDNGFSERMTPDYLYFSKDMETDTDKNINEITKLVSDIEIDVKQNTLLHKLNEFKKENLTNIQVRKIGKVVIVNIIGTFDFTVASGTAEVIGTIPQGYRPSMFVSGAPVIGKSTGYVYCPDCYVQIRNNGDIEFYQNSGSSKSIVQIIGSIVYTTE